SAAGSSAASSAAGASSLASASEGASASEALGLGAAASVSDSASAGASGADASSGFASSGGVSGVTSSSGSFFSSSFLAIDLQSSLIGNRQYPSHFPLGLLEPGRVIELTGGVLEAQPEQLAAHRGQVVTQVGVGHV